MRFSKPNYVFLSGTLQVWLSSRLSSLCKEDLLTERAFCIQMLEFRPRTDFSFVFRLFSSFISRFFLSVLCLVTSFLCNYSMFFLFIVANVANFFSYVSFFERKKGWVGVPAPHPVEPVQSLEMGVQEGGGARSELSWS